MGEELTNTSNRKIDRRRALQTIGAGMATGLLAGCSSQQGNSTSSGSQASSGGSGGSKLGERVPTLNLIYWSNAGNANMIERFVPVIQQNLKNRLGVDIKPKPTEWATSAADIYNDKRTANLNIWAYTNNPAYLIPNGILRRYTADYAGANGKPNGAQYANCDYTYWAVNLRHQTNKKDETKYVNNAVEIFSKDMASIPIFDFLYMSAIRADQVDVKGINGKAGLTDSNTDYLIKSKPKGNLDHIALNIPNAVVTTTNFPTIPYLPGYWNHLVHSPLVHWNTNFEIENVLAEKVDTSADGKTTTVTLKDATFQNGDPLDAKAVKFTFDLLDTNFASYPNANEHDYESIDVVDDKTVKFTLKEADNTLVNLTFARWGILHPKTWKPALENPGSFKFKPMIGSGPFKATSFQSGSHLYLEPFGNHPVYSPDHKVELRVYRDSQAVAQAFKSGELQVSGTTESPSGLKSLKKELGDKVKTVVTPGISPYSVEPQMDVAPSKFKEFRQAMAAAFDRKKMNDLGSQGTSNVELHCTWFGKNHPWRPSNDTLVKMAPPSGDEKKARKILTDNGWGWDGQGRLHYPADADLTPRWPEGKTPTSANYPCLTEKGEYKSSYTASQ